MNKQLPAAALMSAIMLISAPAMSQQRAAKQPATTQQAAASDKAARHALIYKIVKEWGPYVRAIHGENIGLWADRMVPTFRQADTAKLKAAAQASTFEGMNNALLGQKSYSSGIATGIAPKTLGSTVNDLTYTALAGCLLVDTRVVGGAFAAGVSRHFKASGANFTAQGGSNTNCGIPSTPVSLVLSVAAISPTSNGYFRMWPYGTAMPAASNISYRNGENIQNDIILKMSQGLTQDFSVQSQGSSHLVVNVLGYFAAPQATALECVNVYDDATTVIPANSNDYYYSTASCPSGYALMSMYCWNGGQNGLYSGGSGTNSGWCQWINTNGAAVVAYEGKHCCRVPGR